MASKGYVEAYLNRLAPDMKQAFVRIFEYILTTLQLGGVEHQERATNFGWYRLESTTATTANEEFTVVHGLGQIPRWVTFQSIDVTSSGGQMVRLRCTKAADANRIYLSSPDTNAQITLWVEA